MRFVQLTGLFATITAAPADAGLRPGACDARPADRAARLAAAAAWLADAENEYDHALAAGCPMPTLVLRDREVARAARAHELALLASRAVRPVGAVLPVLPARI